MGGSAGWEGGGWYGGGGGGFRGKGVFQGEGGCVWCGAKNHPFQKMDPVKRLQHHSLVDTLQEATSIPHVHHLTLKLSLKGEDELMVEFPASACLGQIGKPAETGE